MNKLFPKLIAALLSFLCIATQAQSAGAVEMADIMRSNGKIYVVVAVIAIIFIGIVLYLVHIDRKVSRLEKSTGKEKE